MKTEKNKTMSDRKHSDRLITNEDTVNRRAWIEKAVSVAKGTVEDAAETVESGEQSGKPSLYIVDSKLPR
jgi:hypothetical protein